jgi:hypothetical protein
MLETFDKSLLPPFRAFLAVRPHIKKWIIASDYCLHDRSRPRDCFAFSIIPYDDWPENIFGRIRAALPRDIKNAHDLGAACIHYLRQADLFHIAIVKDKKRRFYTNGIGSDALVIARESIRMDLQSVIVAGRGAEQVARMRKLQQESLAKAFNVRLMTDLSLLSIFVSFVSLLLARESRAEIIGWFSDRDALTTWCEGVLWDYATEYVLGIGEKLGIPVSEVKFSIALPDRRTSGEDVMWYDEFIRVADYFAGTLAAWDPTANLVPGNSGKYVQMLREVIADAVNLAVLRLCLDDAGLQASRVAVTRSP